MKQVAQRVGKGEIVVQEVPEPLVRDRLIKISTQRSLISAGTERAKVALGDQSLLAKARARPDLVRKVIDEARRKGIW